MFIYIKKLNLKFIIVGITMILLGSSSVYGRRNYSYSKNTGKILWKYEFKRLNKVYMNKATISGNYVVVKMGTEDMIALDKKTGHVIWKKLTNNPNINAHYPPVAIWNNRIFSANNVSSTNGIMESIDLRTGKLLWQYRTPKGTNPNVDYPRRQINVTPIVKNGKLYFHDFQGVVYCLDALNGSLIWKTDINVVLNIKIMKSWSPTFQKMMSIRPDALEFQREIYTDNNSLFVMSSQGHILSLNLANGRKNWLKKLKVWRATDSHLMGTFNGRTYALRNPWVRGTRTIAHTLIAFDNRTGKQIWKTRRLPADDSGNLYVYKKNLLLSGVYVLSGTPDHISYFTKIKARNGRIISRKKFRFSLLEGINIYKDKYYYIRWTFRGRGSSKTFSIELFCNSMKTGRTLWHLPLVKNSKDWYFTGRTPRTQNIQLLIQNDRAFVTIDKSIWCIKI